MMRRLALFALILPLSALVSGCLEEKVQVKLQPDGRGTLHWERTMGSQVSEMVLGFAGENKEEAARDFAAKQLAEWEGISAWSDVTGMVTEDGRIKVSATGWFSNLNEVKQSEENQSSQFSVAIEGGAMTVTRVESPNESGESQEDSLFGQPDESYAMAKQMTKGMLSGMMGDLKIEVAVELPAPITKAQGFSQEGNVASFRMSAQELMGMIDTMFALADELRPKVKAGEMTVEQAEAEAKKRIEQEKTYTASCQLPAEDAAARDAFTAKLTEATKAWETSDWKGKVEEAKAAKAAEGDMDPMGMPGDEGGEDHEEGEKGE